MTKRSLVLGAGLAASFLMLAGMECPARGPLVPSGGGAAALLWNLIGGGNRTVSAGQSFSIAHEIILTDGYAGDRATYDLSVTGLPSGWQAQFNPASITCPPGGEGRPETGPKSSSGCVAILQGTVPAGQAAGDYPYSVRAQRRGTSESRNTTGTITVPAGNQFGLRLASNPADRTITTSAGYPTDDATAEWQIAVDAPDDFTGTVDLLEASFVSSALNAQPISLTFEPTSVTFSNGQMTKSETALLKVLRLADLVLTVVGTHAISIRARVRGLTGDLTLVIPASQGLEINTPDPGPGGEFDLEVIDKFGDNRIAIFPIGDDAYDRASLRVRVTAPDSFTGTVQLSAEVANTIANDPAFVRKTFDPQTINFRFNSSAKQQDAFVRFERLNELPGTSIGSHDVTITGTSSDGHTFSLLVPEGLIISGPADEDGLSRRLKR